MSVILIQTLTKLRAVPALNRGVTCVPFHNEVCSIPQNFIGKTANDPHNHEICQSLLSLKSFPLYCIACLTPYVHVHNHVLLLYLIAQPCLIALSYCTTMSCCTTMPSCFIILHNHVLLCLTVQPCLLALSYCATMSYCFILLHNHVFLLYHIVQS